MASTHDNDLRLEEMATGEQSGTWGTKTNTNLELIADSFGSGTENMSSDANTTITMADGTADAVRSLFLTITSTSLSATREVTLAPNTINKIWIIKNSTTGSQIITIKQGSGGTVNIANGETKVVVTDGAGSGAAVTEVPLIATAGGSILGNVTLGSSAKILADALNISSETGTEEYITAAVNGAVNLFHNDVSVFSTTADGADVTTTGAIKIPVGTTAERPGSPATGDMRFNSTLTSAEIYNGSAFVAVGGGATGGGSDQVFVENGQTVTTNYTITTNNNALSTGPITVNSGITVTIPSGSRYVVI
jgi:hypothetical protein|tara:strand:- start:35 stop:955 length:921 start_codon:yes stop_codon:yes gene_type:complete